MKTSRSKVAPSLRLLPDHKAQDIDAELEALWSERQELIASIELLRAQIEEAESKLPPWACEQISPGDYEIRQTFRAEANILHDVEGRKFAVSRYRTRARE